MGTRPLLTPKARLVAALKSPEEKALFAKLAREEGLQDKQFLDGPDVFRVASRATEEMIAAWIGFMPLLQQYIEVPIPDALAAAAEEDPELGEAMKAEVIATLEALGRERAAEAELAAKVASSADTSQV